MQRAGPRGFSGDVRTGPSNATLTSATCSFKSAAELASVVALAGSRQGNFDRVFRWIAPAIRLPHRPERNGSSSGSRAPLLSLIRCLEWRPEGAPTPRRAVWSPAATSRAEMTALAVGPPSSPSRRRRVRPGGSRPSGHPGRDTTLRHFRGHACEPWWRRQGQLVLR
jgi:hypothetical protein